MNDMSEVIYFTDKEAKELDKCKTKEELEAKIREIRTIRRALGEI